MVFGRSQGVALKISVIKGITVIELLVVLSTLTLLLAVGVPRVEDIAIRARVNEGLVMAAAARQAVQMSCINNPSAQIYELDEAGLHLIRGQEEHVPVYCPVATH